MVVGGGGASSAISVAVCASPVALGADTSHDTYAVTFAFACFVYAARKRVVAGSLLLAGLGLDSRKTHIHHRKGHI